VGSAQCGNDPLGMDLLCRYILQCLESPSPAICYSPLAPLGASLGAIGSCQFRCVCERSKVVVEEVEEEGDDDDEVGLD
jgi:hypothetical protein